MSDWNSEELIAADKQFVWHPFTDMSEWRAPEHEPSRRGDRKDQSGDG